MIPRALGKQAKQLAQWFPVVSITGPRQSGKSTLANLVCRFFDVQSGSVRVGGADVRDIPKEELMDTISFVFQNSRLLKGSILDNVRLGRAQATEAEVLAALKAAQCMDIVEKFPEGIHTVIGTKGVYLSGGEQQRIAIARALATDPKVLLCDEATSALDPNTTHAILTLIKDINKKLGITVVVITHQMSVVEEICDHVAILDGGVVVEQGPAKEIFTAPREERTRAFLRLVEDK